MIKKIALTAALVLGTATAAFAEDSSSSFSFNIYPQAGQQQVLTSRNVALDGGHTIVHRAPAGYDRASSSHGGSSF